MYEIFQNNVATLQTLALPLSDNLDRVLELIVGVSNISNKDQLENVSI
jgi:hypothetical protein